MARAVAPPIANRLGPLYAGADLADAYAIGLPADATHDIERLTRFLLADPPLWLRMLLGVRDAAVAGFGLKTSRQLRREAGTGGAARIDLFRLYEIAADEAILGEDDRHLDFRVSVQRRPSDIVATTVVRCHNRLGRLYLALIAPFHRIVVRSMLQRAGQRGWPKSTPGSDR